MGRIRLKLKDKLFYIKKIIVFIAVVFLMVYHTFTFMQRYYAFIVTIAVGFIVSFITYITDFRRDAQIRLDLRGVLCVLSLLGFFLLSFFFKEDSLTFIFGKYIPYFLWPILFMLVRKSFCEKEKKYAMLIVLIAYFIGNLFTISFLQADPDAARLLAGVATMDQRIEYYKSGVGGYGYVYGSILLLYAILFWIKNEVNVVVKIFLIFVLCSGYVMIFFAGYTTALLLLAASILLWLFFNFAKKGAAFLLFLFFGAFYLCRFFVVEKMILLFDSLQLAWFSMRFAELRYAMLGDDYESLDRAMRYEKSLNCFYSNPFWGGMDIGEHSEIFDMLGKYGIMGACFVSAFIYVIYYIVRDYPVKYKISFVLLLLFMFVNPLDQMVMLPMCLFVTPLLFDYLYKTNRPSNLGYVCSVFY